MSQQFHLGNTFPNFSAEAYGLPSDGKVFDLYSYMSPNWWCILFSHPGDFTPVCTTELGTLALRSEEFTSKQCKLVGLSCNDCDSHALWAKDIMAYCKLPNQKIPFPIIADSQRVLANQLGIIDPIEIDSKGLPLTCRSLFFISPDKKLKAKVLYPATTGRSVDEILRVLDSLQLTEKYSVATPEGWSRGKDCMILPNISDKEAYEKFFGKFVCQQLPSGKNYLRYTNDPRISEA